MTSAVPQFGVHRRAFLLGLATSLMTIGSSAALAESLRDIANLLPGEYTWHPERQEHGPVSIIVSLPQQLVHVYRNGVRIAVSTCSSGKPGHGTPTGVFVVLQKDKHHRSSTYNNAPMPNMNRLTWSGIALHAGNLPGYPASHGCIRLPLVFSEMLFGITHLGTPVIIAGHDDPWNLTHPGLVLDGTAAGQFSQIVEAQKEKARPPDWDNAQQDAITSIIASSADKRILLIENGVEIADAPLTIAGDAGFGGHVFTLQETDLVRGIVEWIDITNSSRSGRFHKSDTSILMRMTSTDSFVAAMQERMHVGMVLVLTDAPLHPDTISGSDFVIMS